MILKFKQKLCQNGFPMVDLQGEGYENWDCYDGLIEYQIEFDVKEYGIKDIIPSIISFRVHIEEMDGKGTDTIDLKDVKYKDFGQSQAESWTQLGDAIDRGLHISHVVLDLDSRIVDVCLK